MEAFVITGGTGMIGKAITEALIERDLIRYWQTTI